MFELLEVIGEFNSYCLEKQITLNYYFLAGSDHLDIEGPILEHVGH